MAKPHKELDPIQMQALAEGLARARIWAGLSQTEVAEIAGCDRMTVVMWEGGKYSPRLSTALALADYYGITLEALVGRAPLPAAPSKHPQPASAPAAPAPERQRTEAMPTKSGKKASKKPRT